MEYDEKELEGEKAEIGCSKLYGVGRFEFDDSLRFGSLVENEVFLLGITDNHWIEEYSGGGNGIDLSSSGVESKNVWSEASCSESVEMLLKSVGQEEKTVDEGMDPNLSRDDGKDQNVVSSVAVVSDKSVLGNEQLALEVEENSTAVPLDMIVEHSKEISIPIPIPMNEPPPPTSSSLLPAADTNTLQGNDISPLEIENENDAHQITSSVNLPETGGESSIHQVGTACLPDEQGSGHEGVAIAAGNKDDNDDEGTEPDVVHVDQELPLDMDIENVESSLSVEDSTSIAPPPLPPNSESDVPDQVDSGMEAETDDHQPKSPILGVSLVHEEKVAVGEDKSQNESSQAAESGVANNPSSSAEKSVRDEINTSLGSVDGSNANEIEPESNTPPSPNNSHVGGGLLDPKESVIPVNRSNEHEANVDADADGGCLEKPQIVSTMELPKDNQDTTTSTGDSLLPCKTSDDLEGNIQPLNDATQEDLPFEVHRGGVFGPTFQVSTVPKVDVHPTRGVKGKAERKPRRKSVGKANHLTTPSATGQVIQFENENVGSKPKLPDLNTSTSTSVFQQPFTDNQQVQLRAQILVYGSLISGSPPEEPHMIAAYGQTDGGRIWEGVWRACLDRLQVQKAQAIANTPPTTQLRSVDEGGVIHKQKHKHAASVVQNKVVSSPSNNNKGTTPSPMIPLSSPLWSIATPSSSSSSSSSARLQALSPFQAPSAAVGGVGPNPNPYWLSQGVGPLPLPLPLPFAAQWVATSPIPPRFPLKESKHTSAVLNSGLEVSGMYDQPSAADPKSRKRKKTAASVNQNSSAHVVPIHLPQGMGMVSMNQTDSVTSVPVSTSAFITSKSKFPFAQHHQHTSGVEETLSRVEESKMQAKEAAERAVSHCHVVWSQLERQKNCGMSCDDEAKLVSSAVALAAAASVAKVAAAAAQIASDVATSIYLSNTTSQKNPPNSNVDDAIVKAAQLAAEAVSQAGKIVGMREPLPLRHLVEAGPEGYWKTPVSVSVTAEAASQKGIGNTVGGIPVDGIAPVSTTNKRKPRIRKVSKTIPESDIGSCKDENDNNIKEGSLVEVYKDDDGAWFGAHVLSLKDGKALVCYAEIQSDEGGKLKEWVPLVAEGAPPKTRAARPLTKKRSRTAATDFVWSTGDPVDVWMQDRWREGVVVETNKIDPTALTVKFSGEGETSTVGSWFVRPTLIWKDHKWVTASSSQKGGDTPNEKRMKLGSPIILKETSSNTQNRKEEKVVESKKQEESTTTRLALSVQETLFSVGSNANANSTRRELQKGGPRVVFGVPKPGKKQKFMDVSRHYDAGDNNHHRPTTRLHHHDSSSVKFTKYLIPQAPRAMKNNHAKEKQIAAAETRPRIPRKPPVPSLRTLASSNKTTTPLPLPVPDSDDNQSSGHQNQNQTRADSAAETRKTSTRSERVNKRKFLSAAGKEEEEALSAPEHHQVEPSRRSNRKIQPTSRLLEGLQSSITISKIPSASLSTQRTNSTPKGNTNNT